MIHRLRYELLLQLVSMAEDIEALGDPVGAGDVRRVINQLSELWGMKEARQKAEEQG